MVYDLLKERMPNRCDRRYLEILELAAKEGEARVEDALRLLLGSERGRETITDKESFKRLSFFHAPNPATRVAVGRWRAICRMLPKE